MWALCGGSGRDERGYGLFFAMFPFLDFIVIFRLDRRVPSPASLESTWRALRLARRRIQAAKGRRRSWRSRNMVVRDGDIRERREGLTMRTLRDLCRSHVINGLDGDQSSPCVRG